MPVDPTIADNIARAAALRQTFGIRTIQDARIVAQAVRDTITQPVEVEVASVSAIQIPAAGRSIRALVFRPCPVALGAVRDSDSTPTEASHRIADGTLPTIVYFHGGSWTTGSPESTRAMTSILCNEVGAVVVSVAYRLAPEHPFPAGFDDAADALGWVVNNITDFGGDPGRIAIAGDSAGGNFCAGLLVKARDESLPLAAALLLYPSTDLGRRFESMDTFMTGYGLETPPVDLVDPLYLTNQEQRFDPRVSPLRATSFVGLAPTLVNVAEFDPLLDHGTTFADALATDGVNVQLRLSAGMVHGYPMHGHSDAAQEEFRQTCRAFAELLG